MTVIGDKTGYVVDPQFPKQILETLTEQVKELTYDRSLINNKPSLEDLNSVERGHRTSSSCWIPYNSWIAGIMHNLFICANNEYFHFELNHFDSDIQATRYEVGQHYGWHTDQFDVGFGRLTRKLSMSLVLDTEFEGGELELFHPLLHQALRYDLKPGQVCIFPSWISHQVQPVTSGIRYSLVAWMNGPEFR